MLVRLIDPPAYTPPYDHALAAALAQRGLDVELLTSEFRYGAVPQAQGYAVKEVFYRHGRSTAAKLAQHPADMLRLRRLKPAADINHFQWLPVQAIDRLLLPKGPNVLTAHDVVPREPRPGQLRWLASLYRRLDAIVVHSENGRDRLVNELEIDPAQIEVVSHGAFNNVAAQAANELPIELRGASKPVVLAFGLIRPYKGTDVLIEAMREIDAELWIVGMPRMDLAELRRKAEPLGERVRWLPRFVDGGDLVAVFQRADIVCLPYREIDQSGVLYTALAFGKPMVVSRVGGFGEVADQDGAALAVRVGDPYALAAALMELLGDPQKRARLAEAAGAAATGRYSWAKVAEQTETLYRRLIEQGPSH